MLRLGEILLITERQGSQIFMKHTNGLRERVDEKTKPDLIEEKTRQPWKKPDSTEPWNYVIKTMASYDDNMVEGWKEELGNLLIFVRTIWDSGFQTT